MLLDHRLSSFVHSLVFHFVYIPLCLERSSINEARWTLLSFCFCLANAIVTVVAIVPIPPIDGGPAKLLFEGTE